MVSNAHVRRRTVSLRVSLAQWSTQWSISFPESSLPLTSGRKTRALGATILKKQRKKPHSSHSVSLRSLHLWRTPEMVVSRALVFRSLVKGNEDSGNEIAQRQNDCACSFSFCSIRGIDKFCDPPQCLRTHIFTFMFSAFNGHMRVLLLTMMLTYRLMKSPWCNLFHIVQGSCETNPRVRFSCMVPLLG